MEIFTYKDYLKYQKFLKEKQKIENELHEDNAIYTLPNKKVSNEHDKIFRRILDEPKEAAKFINKTLKLKETITEGQLEKYNSSFVTIELKNQEADIIYKVKGKSIFFLIEHQTKIDYAMPLRILEYSVEIMKSATDKKKLRQKGYKFPTVIPIVLYTGKVKWNVESYIKNVQEELKGYENLEFAKYNIVDVNDYTKEELLQEESFLSKAMLIEKARYTDSLAADLEKIIQELNMKNTVYTKEQKELLITIIELTLKRKLEKEETNKLIKSLKEGSGQMLAVLEMIDEENKRIFRNGERKGKREGRREAKLENAKKMLEEKIPIKTIIKITGLTKEELEKLRE